MITALCILFAALAASPQRTLGFVAVLVVLGFAAASARHVPWGLAWLVAGAVMGLAVGLLLGIACVVHAYGPMDKRDAWSGFWTLAYAGPLVGGFLALSLANARRPVAIGVALGGVLPLAGIAVFLFTTRAESGSGGVLILISATLTIGCALGAVVGDALDGSATPRYFVILVIAAVVLGSCLLSMLPALD